MIAGGMSRRVAGAITGAAAGAWLALVPAVAVLAVNPWFLDAAGTYLALVTAPLAALGALLGARRGGRRARWTALGLAVAAVPALAWGWPRPGQVQGVRLLVVGVDGATFDVIDAMEGELPAFAAMQHDGARARLMSMDPMFSPLLWTTMATGEPPEEHGVFGFHVQSTDCRAARFWDVMGADGLSVGTWKWLVTYPPQRDLAFQVPAWLAPGPETWPEDLSFAKALELSRRMARRQVGAARSLPDLGWDAVRHGVRWSTVVRAAWTLARQRLSERDSVQSYYDGQVLRVWMDRDVFVATLHRTAPDVATFTMYATDAVPHRMWRYHEPAAFPGTPEADVARWGEAVRDVYRQADAVLGALRAEVGPGAATVVVSDHGFRAMAASETGRSFAPRTERLAARLAAEVGPVDVSRRGRKLVVAATGPDPGAERAAVEAWLGGVLRASTGQPLYRWEGVPDRPGAVGLTLAEGAFDARELSGDRVGDDPLGAFVSLTEAYSGDHDPAGVFLAAGPGIAAGARLGDLGLLDVAPTLLALVGLPQAEDMAGEVPAALWEAAPALPAGPESYDGLAAGRDFVDGSAGVNEELLRALGYVE